MLNTAPTGIYREITTVWFRHNPHEEKIFHCPVCTYPLFKYQGEVIMMVPGDANNAPKGGVGDDYAELKPVQAPFRQQCRGFSKKYGRCTAEYLIEGFTR